MPFLPTNQQSQSTEGKTIQNTEHRTIINCLFSADLYHKQWSTIKTGYLQFQPMTFSLDIQHPKDINIKLKYIFTAVYDDEFEPMLITNWAASFLVITMELGWLGNRVVSVLDSGAEGPGFKSQSRRGRVTVLGKLFTPIVPLFNKQQNW